jgi:intracellular sulfur oxidation DsrE/DsrF family protein
MGVRFIVCEMGLRAEGLDRSALRGDLPIEAAGVVTLLTEDDQGGTAWMAL